MRFVRKQKRADQQRGFTLETAVAMVVMMVGGLGSPRSFPTPSRTTMGLVIGRSRSR